MRIGIDLLWVRVGICGGTESFIRNLMEGFAEYDADNEYILFAASDNAETFRELSRRNKRIRILKCPTESKSRIKRIAWENTKLDDTAKAEGIDVMFIPVYSMPRVKRKNGIPYVVTIHDIQGLHYPEYFSALRLHFLKKKWDYSTGNAKAVVTISEYVKKDLIEHYPNAKGRTIVIPDPVILDMTDTGEDNIAKFGIEPYEYFYCVSSMLPHKNLATLLRTMAYRKKHVRSRKNLAENLSENAAEYNEKLVLSGVGGAGSPERKKLDEMIKQLGIGDNVIITGFVSDKERNSLYKYCRAFLFPSVFEGFGMPPVEALMAGRPVITTSFEAIREVTKDKAIYVKDSFDEKEWSQKIDSLQGNSGAEDVEAASFPEYSVREVAAKYIKAFNAANKKA